METHLLHLLDMVFNALVLLVGLQELESVQNVERLKKDLKVGGGGVWKGEGERGRWRGVQRVREKGGRGVQRGRE